MSMIEWDKLPLNFYYINQKKKIKKLLTIFIKAAILIHVRDTK